MDPVSLENSLKGRCRRIGLLGHRSGLYAIIGALGINRNCLVFYLSNSIWWKGTEPIIGVTTDITVAVTTMCFDTVIISTFCLHGFSEDSASETAEWKVPFPAITM